MMNKYEMMYKEDEEKTLVLWHISSCPIPDGHDPSLIGRRIESALKKSGFRSGPLYITAIGNLTEIPGGDDVLRKLSSTGIALKHGNGTNVQGDLFEWTHVNPAPATIMLITDSKELESLARTVYDVENQGYNILLAYPQRAPAPYWLWLSFLSGVSKEWLWNSLLSDADDDMGDDKQETSRLVLQEKCSETDESPWTCSVCDFPAQSFEDFTTHLRSVQHSYSEWSSVASHNNVDLLDPANIPKGQSKEWYLLFDQDMADLATLVTQRPRPFMRPNIATNTMVQQSQPKENYKERNNVEEEAVGEEKPE